MYSANNISSNIIVKGFKTVQNWTYGSGTIYIRYNGSIVKVILDGVSFSNLAKYSSVTIGTINSSYTPDLPVITDGHRMGTVLRVTANPNGNLEIFNYGANTLTGTSSVLFSYPIQ